MGNPIDSSILTSSLKEDVARDAPPNTIPISLRDLMALLPHEQSRQLPVLIGPFAVPESGIGVLGLAQELRADLQALRGVLDLPAWVTTLEKLLTNICDSVSPAVKARDLVALRSQRKNPLRDFLTQPKLSLNLAQQNVLRATRGLLGLRLLSRRKQLTELLATELARALRDGFVLADSTSELTPARLHELKSALPADSPRRKLIATLSTALETPLPDPFPNTAPEPRVHQVTPPSPEVSQTPTSPIADDELSTKDEPDHLQGRKAAIPTAGSRVFSGIADLYDFATPFELEVIVPSLVRHLASTHPEETTVALIALFTTLLPGAYGRLPLTLDDRPGVALDLAAGHLCWNLDYVITGKGETAASRYVRVPLPMELLARLRSRQAVRSGAVTLAHLFDADLDELGKQAKAMLRTECALSSHRPTLTRLSLSWGRYVLHRCQDETYASAVGLDFTLGTTANLNYVRLQGRRMVEVVSDCYRQVGLSGQCGSQPDDTGTERLPALHTAENVVKQLFGEVDAALAKLPRRCNAVRLSQTHNVIATRLYAALKLLLAGRSLSEETMTARSLDPDSGLVELVDKRPAPYHEYRIVLLPPYCRAWISTYLAWLSSLAYRLDTINPPLSRDIAGIVDRSDPVVRHPLFFRIMPDGRTCPLGSADIAKLLAGHGIAPNAGRHLVDKLFRDAGLDSAVVMAWMGRGMPGQEAYGSGSAAVPLDVMRTGSEVIETWLATLRLPQVLQIAPRQLGLSHTQIKKPAKYTPQLLTERPASLRHSKGMERCPFAEATPRLSAEYSRILQAWRRSAPPEGLAAVALSLVLEDGVQHVDELHATLDALQCGPIHAHEDLHFVDSRSSTLGIRRVWLSPVTLRLALQTQHSDPTTRSDRSLTGAIAALLVRANVSASGDPLQHLVRAAQAFAGLRVPGICHRSP